MRKITKTTIVKKHKNYYLINRKGNSGSPREAGER
jgi:predicted transcriptional regulator